MEHLIGCMDVKNVAVIGARYIGIEIAEAAISVFGYNMAPAGLSVKAAQKK